MSSSSWSSDSLDFSSYLPSVEKNNCCPQDLSLYGYSLKNFYLMPATTNFALIVEAMTKIVEENKEMYHKSTSFSGSPYNSLGLPYMELLITSPESNGTYYVYSSTNGDNYSFTTDSSKLEYDAETTIPNPFRFYMWNSTIFNLAVEPTEQFPTEKTFKFKNALSSDIVQTMELKASTIPGTGEAYTVSTVNRNTIYIYYPSSVLYCLIDTVQRKIYVMQTGNNQKTGLHPLTPENMIFTQQLLTDLPEGFIFTCTQIGNNDTVLVVSSPSSPAQLIQDSLGNSYQLAVPQYAKVLYDGL